MPRMSRRRPRAGIWRKLADGGLLAAEKQGRHRYYRLASPLVGQMLEGVMAVAGPGTTARHHVARRRGAAHGAHLLRPPGRTARRGAGRCADRARACHAGHRWRRGDRAGAAVPRRLRCVARAGAAGVLPAVPGLERAAAASRRAGGRRAGVPVLRAWLDRAAARHAGGGDHRRRGGRDFAARSGSCWTGSRAATPSVPWRWPASISLARCIYRMATISRDTAVGST